MLTPRKREQGDVEIFNRSTPSKSRCIDREFVNDDAELRDESTSSDSSEIICYGALSDAKAQCYSSQGLTIDTLPWSRFHTFELVARGEYYYVTQVNEMNSRDIGLLDCITAKSLHSLKRFSGLSFMAIIESSSLNEILRLPKNKKSIIGISVNVFGPDRMADNVGNTLAEVSTYLQHPFFLQAGVRYSNPQYYYSENEEVDLSHLVGPPVTVPTSARAVGKVEDLLERLEDLPDSIASFGSEVIPGPADQELLLTPLKRHQADGIKFILRREDPNFCYSATSDLKRLIGSHFFPRDPELCLGGIVGDVMGLGKTLTMLSAVLCSKNVVKELAAGDCHQAEPRLTRATLIIVTSRQVLDVWISEIKKHLKAGALKVTLFHGDNRARRTEALVDCDVVLTTYRTLVFDWKGHGILQNMGWFRVVLDEDIASPLLTVRAAHWIRNQFSEQFKAAESLPTMRRWCLTGTPIQNSLDDLRSLLRFLHFHPFGSHAFFEQNIVEPLRSDSPNSVQNVQLLLQAVCLRRNVDKLNPPPTEINEIAITLTPEEIDLYGKILADCKTEFDRIVSTESQIKKCKVLFTTILKLRRLCNHGTLQAATTTGTTPSGRTQTPGKGFLSADRYLLCDFCCKEEQETAVLLDGFETCPECSRYLGNDEAPPSSLSIGEVPTALPTRQQGYLQPCASTSRNSTPRSLSPLSPQSFFQPGYSSKLAAVADNLKKSLDSKNLVFTSWRLTLDILSSVLTQRGISWLQVDGRVSFSDRLEILSKFGEDPNVHVLLMTFETGSVGLTLTAANRVHIVEPQWNPSVEEQAIARAVRMGQTRAVTVIKYITEKSVEQNIVTLQKKKSRLAKFSLDGGTDDNMAGKLDDWKFVLDPGDR